MVVGEHFHELLELVLAFPIGGSQQFLDDLEHRYDVPFSRLAELCHQQNGCCQQTFGGIVEVCVLTEGGRIHTGEDDGLGNDLGILFCFCFIHQLIRISQMQVHIFVDQMKKIVAVGACGVTQIDDRYRVAVLPCDLSIVSDHIAFGIR